VCRSSGYSKAKQLPGPSKKVSWGDKHPKREYDRNSKSIGAIETEEGCHVVNSQEYADYLRHKHTESLNINAIHTQDKKSLDINAIHTVSYNGERPLVHRRNYAIGHRSSSQCNRGEAISRIAPKTSTTAMQYGILLIHLISVQSIRSIAYYRAIHN